jgi:hypothetical protein
VGSTQWVLVKKASSELEVMFLKLCLDGEGIPYMVKNEHVQNLFALGALGGYNYLTGPVEFWVPTLHAESARNALHRQRPYLLGQIPAECPACGALTTQTSSNCPDCGLYLA